MLRYADLTFVMEVMRYASPGIHEDRSALNLEFEFLNGIIPGTCMLARKPADIVIRHVTECSPIPVSSVDRVLRSVYLKFFLYYLFDFDEVRHEQADDTRSDYVLDFLERVGIVFSLYFLKQAAFFLDARANRVNFDIECLKFVCQNEIYFCCKPFIARFPGFENTIKFNVVNIHMSMIPHYHLIQVLCGISG